MSSKKNANSYCGFQLHSGILLLLKVMLFVPCGVSGIKKSFEYLSKMRVIIIMDKYKVKITFSTINYDEYLGLF